MTFIIEMTDGKVSKIDATSALVTDCGALCLVEQRGGGTYTIAAFAREKWDSCVPSGEQ